MTACVADSSDLAVDAEVERLSKKYAPFVKERDGAGESGVVDELALEAAQLRIDDEYRAAAGGPEPEGLSIRHKAAVRVQLCPECKGNRVVHYEYNHRQMQRDCDTCDGSGTISFDKDGAVIRPAGDHLKSVPPPLTEPVFSPGNAAARRRAVLRAQIAKLDKKRVGYHQEISKLTEQADSPDATSTLHSLVAEVMRGIQGQLSKISARIAELETELREGVDQGGPESPAAASPKPLKRVGSSEAQQAAAAAGGSAGPGTGEGRSAPVGGCAACEDALA